MNRARVTALILSLPGLLGCAAESDAGSDTGSALSSDPISVSVDPAVELISIIYRLAGMRQFDLRELPAYVGEIENHFRPFRNHRAVEMARELAESHRIN